MNIYQAMSYLGPQAVMRYGIEASQDRTRIIIQSPPVICVYKPDDAEITLGLFTILSVAAINYNLKIDLDLSELELITASAAVMLFAEITRVQIVTNKSDVISIIKPKSKQLLQLFTSSGLWYALKPGTLRKIDNLRKINCPFQSSINHSTALSSIINTIKINGFDLKSSDLRIFTKGVQEAMLNVMHHAYSNLEMPKSGIGKRWWQACWYNKVKNTFSFIIYDKGIGIPTTLRESLGYDLSDVALIAKSLERGITRLDDPSRGKGSVDIQNVTSISQRSTLLIASNTGFVVKKRGDDAMITSTNTRSFNGTLIEWLFELEGMK